MFDAACPEIVCASHLLLQHLFSALGSRPTFDPERFVAPPRNLSFFLAQYKY
jgi:hypothetical protein